MSRQGNVTENIEKKINKTWSNNRHKGDSDN